MHGLVHGLAQAPEAPAVSCPPPPSFGCWKGKERNSSVGSEASRLASQLGLARGLTRGSWPWLPGEQATP